MLRQLFAFLTLLLTAAPALAEDGNFSGLVDIGGGRRIYLECRGMGSTTVVVVPGLKASADDWTKSEPGKTNVFSEVAGFTRVCTYDRPGVPIGEKTSRSDPLPMPIPANDSTAD